MKYLRDMGLNNITRFAISTLVLLALGACASRITSEVTRFHRDPSPWGETIAIVPLDDRKTGSIEFANYAARVANKLEVLGYDVITTGDPRLLAKMDYAVGPAQTMIRSWPDNYVHYHFHYGRYYPYYYGRYWDEPSVYSYTVYPRTLELQIVTADGVTVFEGYVKSIGREDNMNLVISYLIEAMFQNFPGESGVTKVVTIRKDGTDRPY